MEKEEFIKRAKKMGYSAEDMEEIIKNHEDAEKSGIKLDYEADLIELPVQN